MWRNPHPLAFDPVGLCPDQRMSLDLTAPAAIDPALIDRVTALIKAGDRAVAELAALYAT